MRERSGGSSRGRSPHPGALPEGGADAGTGRRSADVPTGNGWRHPRDLGGGTGAGGGREVSSLGSTATSFAAIVTAPDPRRILSPPTGTPIWATGIPDEPIAAPVPLIGIPVVWFVTPMARVGVPIRPVVTPFARIVTPIVPVGSPITQIGVPFVHSVKPIVRFVTPITSVVTPILHFVTPIARVVTPIVHSGIPIGAIGVGMGRWGAGVFPKFWH